MLRLRKVTIENFRGLRLPIELDFYKGKTPTSVLIYGRNGTGKSSIVNAWEWFYRFEIASLTREGVSIADYSHRACGGKDCYISIDFEHPTINNAKVLFNPKKITSPTVGGSYLEFKELSTYPNYLRYSDLQDFVYKTKAERYKYIAKFFGLEKFSFLQDTLQKTIGKQAISLQQYKGLLNGNEGEIKAISQLQLVNEKNVLTFLNIIAKRHNLRQITKIQECSILIEDLGKIVSNNPIAKELSEWQNFQAKQSNFYPIQKLSTKCDELEKSFEKLKQKEDNIKDLILSQLYELSIEILPHLESFSKCPVCDNTFKGDLLAHIKNKHSLLDELNINKKEFDDLRKVIKELVDGVVKKIAGIKDEPSQNIKADLSLFFSDIKEITNSVKDLVALLDKPLKDIAELKIVSHTAVSTVNKLIDNEFANRKIVTDKIELLSKDENTQRLAKDYSDMIGIFTAFKSFAINASKLDYLTTIHSKLSAVLVELSKFISQTIQTTFNTISADVIDCFNFLESSNPFLKNPELKLITGKDKAVELEIEFVSEKVTPAFKFLSESQVNSFGLAIFLSAVKHFNKEFKFFILDDVVNSFDSFKRPKVSQLIATRFSDFQTLMITHDQVFFDTVQRDFPYWQRYKFTSWDYATGPKFRVAKNYSEEIKEYLDEDKPITAGQALGRYLEWTFGVLNENLQSPIRYRLENTYTLSEFYEPLLKRLKDKLKSGNRTHIVIKKFDSFEQGTIFRNYCAHWKNESNQFTTPEIASIFNLWIEIESLLYCHDCKSFIKLDSSTATDYVKCNCGNLDLKSANYYEE